MLGPFTFEIVLLNIECKAPQHNSSVVGTGAYGKIFFVRVGEEVKAKKRVLFRNLETSLASNQELKLVVGANHPEIVEIMQEYCLAKICSLLKIGPKIMSWGRIDLICYQDCMEFSMEYCSGMEVAFSKLTFQDVRRRLIRNIRMLHMLRIIHKDIKPDNLLYSPSQ